MFLNVYFIHHASGWIEFISLLFVGGLTGLMFWGGWAGW
jgi:hypothetical protein